MMGTTPEEMLGTNPQKFKIYRCLWLTNVIVYKYITQMEVKETIVHGTENEL
jgi:hypothetical protein